MAGINSFTGFQESVYGEKIVNKSAAQLTGLINQAYQETDIPALVSIKNVMKNNPKLFGDSDYITKEGAKLLKSKYGLKTGKDTWGDLLKGIVKALKKGATSKQMRGWIV